MSCLAPIATPEEMNSLRILKIIVMLFTCWLFGQEMIQSEGKITYITSDLIYTEIGSDDYASLGDTLRIIRRGSEIGLLVITNLSQKYSVCQSLVPTDIYQLGDRVTLHKIKPPEPVTPDNAIYQKVPEQEQTKVESGGRKFNHQGSLSLRYSQSGSAGKSIIRTLAAANYRFSIMQPFKISLMIYGNRDFTDCDWNIYQVQVALGNPSDRWYGQVGRVYSPSLSAIGPTDGLLATRRVSSKYSLGILLGVQPSPDDLAFSLETRKLGIYGKQVIRKQHSTLTNTIAMTGQYYAGGIDREFIYHSLYWNRKRTNLSFNQIIDMDRNDDLNNHGFLEWTSLQAALRIRVLSFLTINSRISARQQPIYRSIYNDPVDGMFSEELRTGWYNSLQFKLGQLGFLNTSANFKLHSTEKEKAQFYSLAYATNQLADILQVNMTAQLIQNPLLNGIRLQNGVELNLKKRGFLSGEYDIFSYGYGNRMNKYQRHSFSINYNLMIKSRFTFYCSMELFNDHDFSGQYLFGGLSYRL